MNEEHTWTEDESQSLLANYEARLEGTSLEEYARLIAEYAEFSER
jgi:hypothetical protein